MSVTVEVRIGRRRTRIVCSPTWSSSPSVPSGKRDVEPLVVLCGGVGDRHLSNGHVLERDVADRAVKAVDPHEHRPGAVAVTPLDGQVHVVRPRVDRHVLDDDVVGIATKERADTRVNVLQIERLRTSLRAGVDNINREHLR
jgi:hypothetical protein